MFSQARWECPNGYELKPPSVTVTHHMPTLQHTLLTAPVSQPQICCMRTAGSSPQSRTVRGDRGFGRCKHNGGAAPLLRSRQPATATSNTPLKELQRRRQDGSSPISSITTSSQSGRKLQCQPGASGTLGSGPISDLGLWDHSWSRHF